MDRFEFFSRMPRSEPGGTTFTSTYLSSVPIKATDKIAEIGCGNGGNTVWIARSRCCRVVAVDDEPRYLERTRTLCEEGGTAGLVTTVRADYTSLPFPEAGFRAVIAEAAAMRLGLKQALTLWRPIVKPDGHLCVAYPGVVNKGAPKEVRGPLEERMAEPMGTLEDYEKLAIAAGYEITNQTTLHSDLWEMFYADCVRRAWALCTHDERYEDEPVVKQIMEEARWYRQTGRGRVFFQAFVLRRIQ